MALTWDDLSGEPRTSGEQLVYERCPVCGSTGWNLYVNPETGGWFCFAGSHYAGGFLPVQTGDRIIWPQPRYGTIPAWTEIEIPDVRPLTAEALAYLARRGIDPRWAQTFGLSESALYPGRIVVPFFWNGDLVYWTSRSYSAQAYGPKYVAAPGKHPLYLLRGDGSRVVVVEGVFDAMHVAMAGLPTVALCGKSLPIYLESMMEQIVSGCPVTVILDRDALSDAIRVANRISRFADCTICFPTAKDPGDMHPDDIRKLVENAAR